MPVIYHNLGQCVDGDRFCYFRSTDVEQLHYQRLLWSVPDEMLFFLSRGYEIEIVDKSSNGKGKIERIFVPVLRDVLCSLYVLPNEVPAKRLLQHFQSAYRELMENTLLRKKFLFWDGKIQKVCITARTIHVERESNPLISKMLTKGNGEVFS